jgi:hypothetical protein
LVIIDANEREVELENKPEIVDNNKGKVDEIVDKLPAENK